MPVFVGEGVDLGSQGNMSVLAMVLSFHQAWQTSYIYHFVFSQKRSKTG